MSSNLTVYDPALALRICERVANGLTLKYILDQSSRMPSKATFFRWVIRYPELSRAYEAARELSAMSLEEEALEMARSIREKPGDSVKVRAFEVAMNQLRWSATRRDPAHFGERSAVTVRVPVSITTSLNLGPTGQGGLSAEGHPNIYEVEAKTVQEVADPSGIGGELNPRAKPGEKRSKNGKVILPTTGQKRVPYFKMMRGETDVEAPGSRGRVPLHQQGHGGPGTVEPLTPGPGRVEE